MSNSSITMEEVVQKIVELEGTHPTNCMEIAHVMAFIRLQLDDYWEPKKMI